MNKTKKEIIEGNELIGKFMGAYHCNDDQNAYPNSYWMCDNLDIDLPYDSADFLFHCSWDWLMPVYSKVSDSLDEIMENWTEEDHPIELLMLEDSLLEANIEECFKNIIKCIKWINLKLCIKHY